VAYVQGVFELGTDGPSLIIAAIDGSETSLRAGAYASGLARRQGSKLALVFVHSVGGFARSVPGAAPAVAEANRMTADELKQTIKEQSQRLGIQASFYEREGSPFSEIVTLADELRADAVVVGASTQAGHRFVGSLALHLVRASRWPVTVVP
jgi:nucleotide-binding universal stress UspA family protein